MVAPVWAKDTPSVGKNRLPLNHGTAHISNRTSLTQQSDTQRLLSACLIAGLVALTVLLLIYGANILVPLAIALLVWFFLNALADIFRRLEVGNFRVPQLLALLLNK